MGKSERHWAAGMSVPFQALFGSCLRDGDEKRELRTGKCVRFVSCGGWQTVTRKLPQWKYLSNLEGAVAQQLRTGPNQPNLLPFGRNNQFPRCVHRDSFIVTVGSTWKLEDAVPQHNKPQGFSNRPNLLPLSPKNHLIVVFIIAASWWS